MSIFTSRLRDVMSVSGIQQKSLAHDCGFSPARLNNYIVGRTEPSLDALVSICMALRVSADYLLGITDSPPSVYQSTSISGIQPIARTFNLKVADSLLDGLDSDLLGKAEGYIASLQELQSERNKATKEDA